MSAITDFTPLQKIGQGSFSTVYKVKRVADNQIYALKKIKINSLKPKQKDNALNEIRILASIKSNHIVQYRQAFFDSKFDVLCIVMEFANQGDLASKIKQKATQKSYFRQQEIWQAIHDITQGLKDLHALTILHRDIKTANIFKSQGKYKLGDLNVSKVQHCSKRLAFTQTGTPYYASPEVWRDQPYDKKSDIWSLGCVIYQLCTLQPPFLGKDLEELYQNIQKGIYKQICNKYSEQLRVLIKQCLSKQASKRPTCEQILSNNSIYFSNYVRRRQPQKKNGCLLRTIKFDDNNVNSLQKLLPKPQYKTEHIQTQTNKQQRVSHQKPLKTQNQYPLYPKNYHHPLIRPNNHSYRNKPKEIDNNNSKNVLQAVQGRRIRSAKLANENNQRPTSRKNYQSNNYRIHSSHQVLRSQSKHYQLPKQNNFYSIARPKRPYSYNIFKNKQNHLQLNERKALSNQRNIYPLEQKLPRQQQDFKKYQRYNSVDKCYQLNKKMVQHNRENILETKNKYQYNNGREVMRNIQKQFETNSKVRNCLLGIKHINRMNKALGKAQYREQILNNEKRIANQYFRRINRHR